jgi:S1-C subfamily serine protease
LNVRYRGDGGVILTDIDRGSTAMRIGFRRGDILVKINGVDIRTVADVTDADANRAAGPGASRSISNGRLIRQFFRG